MRSLAFLLGAGMALVAVCSSAWADNLDRTTFGHNVSFKLSSPFTAIPPGGCVPFHISLRNDNASPGQWVVTFLSVSYLAGQQSSTFQQTLTAPANSTSEFDLVVPLPGARMAGGNRTIQVGVTGPGFDNGSVFKRYFAYLNQDASTGSSPFVLLGKDLLGPSGVGPLQTLYKDRSEQFYGSEVDAKALPTDWRAYSGVAAILLKDSEWMDLEPAQRDALCNSIALGGQLTLFTTAPVETVTPELHLPGANGLPGAYGFGTISLASFAAVPPNANLLLSSIQAHTAPVEEGIDKRFSTWDLRVALGQIAVGSAFILTFVFVFGSLVGPVNLFVFARGKHRFRLFWTTPLLSLLASLALILGILCTDGIGGSGRQMVVFFSLPGVNREAVVQEQVARTAVLFSNQWRNTQDYLITPVSPESMNSAMRHSGDLSLRTGTNYSDASPASYVQIGNELSGDWFPTRAISGQYLQAVRPSRSTLSVVNADAFQNRGEAPVVLSSFPNELTEVHLRDAHSGFWMCSHLQPGREQTCTPGSRAQFDGFWETACHLAGGKLRPALGTANGQPGYFYATGTPSPRETLATLGEIRWQVDRAIYLGPWVAAPEVPR